MRARSRPGDAQAACERSAELRGLLAEIAREHGINRALMRQELAFLSHLTRLVGGEPEGGLPARRARPPRRRRRAPPPTASWTCRHRPMAISSFFGLQTSLRGLLAQQRALDITGHNIANASTEGYSRQEAVLAAAPALLIPPAPARTAAPARSSAPASTSQDYRRIRDAFLDLQYRARTCASARGRPAPRALDRVELALAEPGDNGIAAQLGKFWNAWRDVANAPDDRRRPAGAHRAGRRAGRRVHDRRRRSSARRRRQTAQAEYAALAGARRRGRADRDRARRLNKAIRASSPPATAERPDGPPRPAARPALRARAGRRSTARRRPHRRHRSDGTTGRQPLVDRPDRGWTGAAGRSLTPGGKLGALHDLGQTPGGTIDCYRAELDAVAETLATAVNARPRRRRFFTGTAARRAPRSRVAAALQVDAGTVRRHRAAGANDIALADRRSCAATRPSTPPTSAFVARVGAEVSEANAHAGQRPGAHRRGRGPPPGVPGVSLDEEMTNLVRFQRGYQASARAMSTMDEMLDVLINRTGRVGL